MVWIWQIVIGGPTVPIVPDPLLLPTVSAPNDVNDVAKFKIKGRQGKSTGSFQTHWQSRVWSVTILTVLFSLPLLMARHTARVTRPLVRDARMGCTFLVSQSRSSCINPPHRPATNLGIVFKSIFHKGYSARYICTSFPVPFHSENHDSLGSRQNIKVL